MLWIGWVHRNVLRTLIPTNHAIPSPASGVRGEVM